MLEANYCSISPIITKFILKHWPRRGNMFIKYGLCILPLGKIKILHFKNSRITRTRGSVKSIRNVLVQKSFPGNVSIVWKEYISLGESSRNVLYVRPLWNMSCIQVLVFEKPTGNDLHCDWLLIYSYLERCWKYTLRSSLLEACTPHVVDHSFTW